LPNKAKLNEILFLYTSVLPDYLKKKNSYSSIKALGVLYREIEARKLKIMELEWKGLN